MLALNRLAFLKKESMSMVFALQHAARNAPNKFQTQESVTRVYSASVELELKSSSELKLLSLKRSLLKSKLST